MYKLYLLTCILATFAFIVDYSEYINIMKKEDEEIQANIQTIIEDKLFIVILVVITAFTIFTPVINVFSAVKTLFSWTCKREQSLEKVKKSLHEIASKNNR